MKKIKKIMVGAISATAAMINTVMVYADNSIIKEIEENANSAGELGDINSSVNKFSGNLIYFILSLVTAVVLVGLAIALLKAAAGDQREKQEAKGKVVGAVICFILATPAAFFGIAGIIGGEAEKIGDNIHNGGSGNSDNKDTLGSFIEKTEQEENSEYSVYL